MATKPNIALARFADTGSANVTDPPSGSRDTGFVAGDPADEGVMNALLLQHYRWAQFIDSMFGTVWLLGPDGSQGTAGTLVLDDVTWQSVTSGGEQFVTFRVPLPSGARIVAITVYGVEGNAGGEVFRAFFEELTENGSASQISTTKTSGTSGGAASIGWTTADADFSPDGYVMTDLPHRIRVGIAQTSGAAEVRVSSIKIELG